MLKGNRTRLFGTLILVLGVVQQYAAQVIPADYYGLAMMATGVAVIVLRELTTTPAGAPQPPGGAQ